MRKLLVILLLVASPAAAQLGFRDAQKLYDDAHTTLARQAAPGHERLAAVLERLHTPRGWNNTADLYELLQIVRAHRAVAEALGGGQDTQELEALATSFDAHLRGLLGNLERRVRNPDRDNLARYAEANRKLEPPAPGEQRVVFLGDSITDGWKLAEYFPGKPYVNRGISGQITGEMLGRLKADVIDLKPLAVLLLAGTNDLARLVSVEVVENNLSMIGDLARANGVKVIFASILPVSDYSNKYPPQTPQRPPDKIAQINQWLQGHCREKGYTYLDYFSALADDKGMLKADLANDGLHPNADGYKVMAPLAQSAVEQTLAPPAKKRRK